MPTPFVIPVSTAGMLAAVACVVAGGPLFADGLRALRLRRLLSGLVPGAARPGSHGFVRLAGHVALESPLFSPLSQRPCAGYQLEVRAADGSVAGRVGEFRGFKLVSDGCDAFVEAAGGEWTMPVTAERNVAAGEQVSANMAALLDRDVTLRWLRDRRAPMRIVERSVEAGTRVEVLGHARASAAAESAEVEELLAATGTDGAAFAAALDRVQPRPNLRIAALDPLELRVVANGEVHPENFAPPRWRAFGAVLGPVLSLAGLVYLAHAAEATIGGRF
jgi:hypothetical protein